MLGKKPPVKPGAGDRAGPSARLWRSHFPPKRTRALPRRDSSEMTVGTSPALRDHTLRSETHPVTSADSLPASGQLRLLTTRGCCQTDTRTPPCSGHLVCGDLPRASRGLVSDPHRSANPGSAGTGVSGIWWSSGPCYSLAVMSRVL